MARTFENILTFNIFKAMIFSNVWGEFGNFLWVANFSQSTVDIERHAIAIFLGKTFTNDFNSVSLYKTLKWPLTKN